MENSNLLKKIKANYPLIAVVIVAVVIRLLPHPPNMAPVGGLALFCGAKLQRKHAILVTLMVLLLSDLFLGWHDTMIFVYGSFVIAVIIGNLLIKKYSSIKAISAAFFSSIVFYLITNFGVFLVGDLYPKTTSGLIQAYILAIPFFKNSIAGDLVYTLCFFKGYQLLSSLNLDKLNLLKAKR